MANTYTQLYVHIIFAVKGRQNLVFKENKEELKKYISGIVRNMKQKLIAIEIMPDHVHILIGFKPNISLSDLVRDIKNNSSKFINEKDWVAGHFSWQTGFGAFTYSHSQLNSIIGYINNQEKHHNNISFKEEYLDVLKKFNVQFNNEYLFEWV